MRLVESWHSFRNALSLVEQVSLIYDINTNQFLHICIRSRNFPTLTSRIYYYDNKNIGIVSFQKILETEFNIRVRYD